MDDLQIVISWSAVSSVIIGIIKKFIPKSAKYANIINFILSGIGVFVYYLSQGKCIKESLLMAINAMVGTTGVYNLVGKPVRKKTEEVISKMKAEAMNV